MLRIRWVLIPAVVTALCVSQGAGAQERPTTSDSVGVIVGRVIAKDTDLPVRESIVTLVALDRAAATDDSGYFKFTGVPAGANRVMVRMRGYIPAQLTVNVRAGGVDTTRIELAQPARRPRESPEF